MSTITYQAAAAEVNTTATSTATLPFYIYAVVFASFSIVVWLLGQMIINVGMVLALLPVIGIPLPLVSYGGSSLVASIGAVAFMLMVDAENRRLDRRIHESELAAQAASRVAVSAD